MVEKKPKLWKRLPKPSFSKKSLARRMRKVEGATIRHAHKFVVKRWDNIRDVRRNIVIWVLAMGFLIAAIGIQLMWQQQSYQTTAPANDGTYAEAVLGPIHTLNPLFAETRAEQSASYLLFSRLLKYDTTGHLNYDIVTNIKTNDAKTVYTISIRPDVKWHDGTKLTANDVKFTIDLMKNPDVHSVDSGWTNSSIDVKVIDEVTIEFKLESTFAAFKHALTFSILPEHILGRVIPNNIRENGFSNHPIGSGQFKLNLIQDVDVKTDRKVVYMTKNDTYYGGTAKLLHFQLYSYNTNDEIIDALAKNEVNAAFTLYSSNMNAISAERYTTLNQPINSGVYAILNTNSESLKDVALRTAIRTATDTSAIRNVLPKGTPALWLPLIADQLMGDVPAEPEYNKVSAERLLDEAGWVLNGNKVREKDGKTLKLSIVTIKNSELESVLDVLTGQWRALGITIDTKIVDPDDFDQGFSQNILQPRSYDVLLYKLNIGADPDVYAYWHSSQSSLKGLNYSNYSNIISDDALVSAHSRVEPSLRNVKYLTFVRQWLNDVPAIGLYQSTIQYVTSRNTKAFDSSNKLISPIDRYSDVSNWSVGKRSVYKTP